MKNIIAVITSLIASIAIVIGIPMLTHRFSSVSINEEQTENIGMFQQSVQKIDSQIHTVYKIYDHGELIGILQNESVLENHLQQVYKEKYQENFPDSGAHLGQDVYLVDEQSYYYYDDQDQAILNYLYENELYALECTEITFHENDEISGSMYVYSKEDYEQAINEYISYFVDTAEVAAYSRSSQTTNLTSYGSLDMSVAIRQTITQEYAEAPVDQILTTAEEVLEYLKYGEDTEKQYYTVSAYDTVSGVGAKNFGLSATQVMNINRDKISSVDQVLEEGMELCVTYFNSPIDIVVFRQRLQKETVFFSTVYTEDETILQGEQEVRQSGSNGSRNALYTEKWINGVLTSGTLESAVETVSAVSEVVAVGTMALPGVGTGSMRYPVENARISCGWGCYYGHRGTDFIDQYNSWGDVYAVDTGVIEDIGYNYISGNYVFVNHNNGIVSYYGHMRVPCNLPIGTYVQKGDVIGHIGMTGYATGPHVHFYILENEERRNACDGFLDCDAVS